MQVANPKSSHVKSFCYSLSDQSPFSIPLKPISDVPVNECFSIVPKHVLANGGRVVTGWAIWEWPAVIIEAEFHMVWETPDKVLIDVTPKPKDFSYITFLPDSKKQYRGRQVDNIRKPLSRSLLIKRYIETAHNIFIEMNNGDLANWRFHDPGGVKAILSLTVLYHALLHHVAT